MAYDIRSEEFWEEENLHAELVRVAEICHGCRLCSELCPAFRAFFNGIDDNGGWSTGLTASERRHVADLCYQCKLCHVVCPHTAKRGDSRDVDFPRLMLREKMVRVKREGLPLQTRLMANPELIGAIGGLAAPLSNWSARSGLVRTMLEKLLSVDRRRRLPKFHRTSFDRWYRKREKRLSKRIKGTGGKVALFSTCSVNYNRPHIGRSAVVLLAHHDVEIAVPEQRCCGLHYLQEGDLDGVLQNLEFNVRMLRRFAGMGYTIVALQPSCSYMLKVEYPWLDDGPGAQAISEVTMDLCEYLMYLHGKRRLDGSFTNSPGRISYHVPCHMKAQGIGNAGRDLLRLIPGTEVDVLEACSGMGERWGMHPEHYDASLDLAHPLSEGIEKHRPDCVVSDCARAGLQIRQGTGRNVLHPAEVLRYAYGLPLDV